ncbi:HlyD family secretion protein [Catenovulum sp. SM1970]|uniref:HlyD family secretion protein n=1 Tax=Marinifaba aquimaris TaxID=2741323 RepID=UPI001572F20C|nr:HlyD family secretion protein [Marinifaba aquimaris]NTS75292.1 HlyD family secretion protein [Marinifaba aquimaris]
MSKVKTFFSDLRSQVGLVIFAVVLVISGWSYSTRHIESTNNATVQCDVIDVVSEVNGIINEITFEDNQSVKQFDEIVSLESAQFVADVSRTQALLNIKKQSYKEAQNNVYLLKVDREKERQELVAETQSAQEKINSMVASIEEAKQQLQSSETDLNFLKEDFELANQLTSKKAISEREYKNTKRLYESKLAQHSALSSKLKSLEGLLAIEKNNLLNAKNDLVAFEESTSIVLDNAQAKVTTAKADVDFSKAEYELSNINLKRTSILAQSTGKITNRRVSSGDYIEIGQPLASIVSCQQKAWIRANFKETQIGNMKQGQKAEFTIDTYPDVTFVGILESISSGSGSTFSVLPPENATGNFTKVVKRMPVKIMVSDHLDKEFRIGASANVKVYLQ